MTDIGLADYTAAASPAGFTETIDTGQDRVAPEDARHRVRWFPVGRRSPQIHAAAPGKLFIAFPTRTETGTAESTCEPIWMTAAASAILDEIETTLDEDREEGLLHGESCASHAAVRTCRRMVSHIAFSLALPLSEQWAVFGENGGGVSLVIRSENTKRRVDFRISGDGQHISRVRVDAKLNADSRSLSVGDWERVQESLAWVRGVL